jgi:hypothetical protein
MRVINSANLNYNVNCANNSGYAPSLANLATPPTGGGQPFISPDLSSAAGVAVTKSGYSITYTVSNAIATAAATCNGAAALGYEGLGNLSAGCAADFVGVRLDSAHLSPALDLLGNVVFCSRPDDVCLTVSGGKAVAQGGRILGVDVDAVSRRVREIAASLL